MPKNILKYILCTILCFFAEQMISQVSFNTTNALGNAVYIEGGNTGVVTDDVIIGSTGNVGLGKVPSNKLDIVGSMTYANGSPEQDYVLTSDKDGFGLWSYLTIGSQTASWTVSGSKNFSTATALTGTATIDSGDEIGLTTDGTGTVTIPAGRYIVMINGDVVGNEYGIFSLINNTTGGNVFFFLYYSMSLSGTANYFTFSTPTTLSTTFAPITVTQIKQVNNTIFYLIPPYTANFTYTIRFLKLA